MAGKTHHYECRTEWTGAGERGTVDYRSYDRAHVSRAPGRPDLPGSADPAFRGDASRWNPELLLLASLSQCHLLWYLHLCATGGVTVLDYRDDAVGTMAEDSDGGGRFTGVELRPVVTVAAAEMADRARELHRAAHAKCFIAASVNFPVTHSPRIEVAAG
ncbi:OsmC family protein [Nocardia fusca]|jgi:organic hydroperoxide reductase OsmC/OhrA|uniref:OsmC family protein n=1 Tax=Nocardia fusca TaxID=941183 RepID=A0ABV3FG01_9NOCA|nr:OsmC family protein [Nocardia fusca]